MTRYLLDTNVVSVLAPTSRARNAALVHWLDRHEEELHLPSVVVAELSSGVARLRRIGAARKAELLDVWLAEILSAFVRKVIPFDMESAHETGLLIDRARALGLNPGFPDLAIAGVAIAHKLTLLTRNLGDFVPVGVAAVDPFAILPE